MLKIDKFKQLYEKTEKIKRISNEDNETLFWEVSDSEKEPVGYAFFIEVPETIPDVDNAEEFDKYEVWGVLNTGFEIIALDICPHPDGPDSLWAEDIVEPGYARQYIGLSADKVKMKPDGQIDGITDATISSRLVVEAVKRKIDSIISHINQ